MQRTTEEHRRLVQWFANLMLLKLAANAHKPHWLTMTVQERRGKRWEEQGELDGAVMLDTDGMGILMEAVDVALCAAFEADAARVRMEAKGDE